MLIVQDVAVRYADGDHERTVLDIDDLRFEQGSTVVMGPSGSGKSTLLNVLGGFQKPTTGSVERTVSRDGTPVRAAMIHQDHRLVRFLTVGDNLRLAAEANSIEQSREDVGALLHEVGLDGFENRWPEHLSGGEKQRVAIARALAMHAQVILADEPTGSLDVDNAAAVAQILRQLGSSGRCVVVATHDPTVAGVMDRMLHLDSGRLV